MRLKKSLLCTVVIWAFSLRLKSRSDTIIHAKDMYHYMSHTQWPITLRPLKTGTKQPWIFRIKKKKNHLLAHSSYLFHLSTFWIITGPWTITRRWQICILIVLFIIIIVGSWVRWLRSHAVQLVINILVL